MKKEIKHAVFGIGITNTDRCVAQSPNREGRNQVGLATLPRERWNRNTKTNKIYYKVNGYLTLPIYQIKGMGIEQLRSELHKAVNECCDSYKSINHDKYDKYGNEI